MKPFFIFVFCSFLCFSICSNAQQGDTLRRWPLGTISVDSIAPSQKDPLTALLNDHRFLNSKGKAVKATIQIRHFVSKDAIFYFLAVLFLFLGIIKVSFDRYFTNLLRVFFNTSLRQSQLTDQLLQAKLPSLFFNVFFVVISGLYIYLLLVFFGRVGYDRPIILLWCVLAVLAIYLCKYLVLKFAGWLTGFSQEAETYIFIVFLINKMIALLLVPIVIVIAFSSYPVIRVAVIASYILIALMLAQRFLRSYGLLQNRLKVSRFHFLLYIIGIELLPILLIYKAALVIVTKNL